MVKNNGATIPFEKSGGKIKDYIDWMAVKKKINNDGDLPIRYHEKEIWLCSVGENVGFEEDGKGTSFVRPVLILKIYSSMFCHIIPLSTVNKCGKYYYNFNYTKDKQSVALLSQLRPIDTRRLKRKVGAISDADYNKIRESLRILLEL